MIADHRDPSAIHQRSLQFYGDFLDKNRHWKRRSTATRERRIEGPRIQGSYNAHLRKIPISNSKLRKELVNLEKSWETRFEVLPSKDNCKLPRSLRTYFNPIAEMAAEEKRNRFFPMRSVESGSYNRISHRRRASWGAEYEKKS